MSKLIVDPEVESKIRDIFGISKADEEKSSRDKCIEISRPTEDSLKVEVKQMYSYVDCSFGRLKKLSDLLGTDEIDMNNWASKGCDTCDFGSCYTVAIDIKEIKTWDGPTPP